MHNEAISPFLSDALVILGAAGIVIPVFARFRITPVIGFILVGVLVGPYGLGRMVPASDWLRWITITDPEGLEPFAEFGITLLLFTIGLELSFKRLWTMRRLVFGLGLLELAGIGLLVSALTPRRGLGVASVVGVLLVVSGLQAAVRAMATEFGNDTFTGYAGLLSPYTLVDGVASGLLGADSSVAQGPPGTLGTAVFTAVTVLLVVGCYAGLVARYRKALA